MKRSCSVLPSPHQSIAATNEWNEVGYWVKPMCRSVLSSKSNTNNNL